MLRWENLHSIKDHNTGVSDMARAELITKHDLEHAIKTLKSKLKREPTNREIANCLTVSTKQNIREDYVSKFKNRHLDVKKRLSHKKFIIWPLLSEDLKAKEAQYLRILSAIAQEEMRPAEAINKAFGWIDKAVNKGLDVKYVTEDSKGNSLPKAKRWVYFPADPKNWHLKNCQEKAAKGLALLTSDK